MNFKIENIMKQITKMFLIACMCAVSLSCSKDDDEEKGGDYVCYECTMSYDNGGETTTFPVCGEKTYAEILVKSYENQSGYGMTIRCVRKK